MDRKESQNRALYGFPKGKRKGEIMAIFKLKKKSPSVEDAVLVHASKTKLGLEKHLEGWLENSPWAISQEPLLIIGRQTTAIAEDSGTVFPDLLGLDRDGNIVIIELKKGKTPKEVVAQLLEYAAWAGDLSDEKIKDIGENYLKSAGSQPDFEEVFTATFETAEMPSLNQRLRCMISSPWMATGC